MHGEGVAIGLACAARLSVKLGHMSGQDASRVENHLRESGLPSSIRDIATNGAITPDSMLGAMYQDKKVTKGTLTFILMGGIGQSFIARGVTDEVVLDFLSDELNAN